MLSSYTSQISIFLTVGLVLSCQTDKTQTDETAITSSHDTATPSDTAVDQVTDTGTIPENDTATELDSAVDPDTPNVSSGCGSSSTDLGSSIVIEGETRTYELSLPADYDPQIAYPLIFAWHGRGGSGIIAKLRFGLEDSAGAEAIIVYPDGLPQPLYGGDTGWEVRATGSDIILFDQLFARITENTCIDMDRVFATGHSFGGFMTNFLGCQRGNLLRAIAPVASGGPRDNNGCQGSVAVQITHGTNDSIIELSEGEASLAKWQTMNSCSQTSIPSNDDHCVAYEDCTQPVRWCEFSGGHMWPSFAGESIWSFFMQQ